MRLKEISAIGPQDVCTALTMIYLIFLTFLVAKMSALEYFAPSLFLNHGGGPNPVLGEKHNLEIADSLRNVSKLVDLSRLKSIIVVTAHREEDIVTISSGKNHELVYDYSNFPPESYKFKYNASGNPALAQRLHEAFTKAGIPSRLDDQRGWDHGVFIPMMLANPSANIPIVQLSILRNQNAVQHYEIGKVLYEFRKDGIAVFGSGLSFHNMPELMKYKKKGDGVIMNADFDEFLNDVCTGDVEKRGRICDWDKQDGGLYCHPVGEADHLMPLIVNAGAAGSKPGRNIFDSVFLGKFKLSGFIWD